MRRVAGGAGSAGVTFVAEVPMPVDGYAALFAEVELETDGEPFRLSTQIRVIPEGL